MGSWGTFAAVSGGAAGALIGLLFVAVSIRIDVISHSIGLRSLAAQTLVLFGDVLLVAIALAIPGQANWALGIELVALALSSGAGLIVLDRRAKTDQGTEHLTHILDAVSPNTVTSSLLGVAGILCLCGVHAGLYVLALGVVAATVGGLASAWIFLTKIPG